MNIITTQKPFDGCIESRIGGRADNQDNAGFVDTNFGLLVIVCDGMGGGPGGRTASAATVDTVLKEMLNADSEKTSLVACQSALEKAIVKANEVIKSLVSETPDLQGMGTTITAVVFHQEAAVVAHVGDSRVYKVRNLFDKLPYQEIVFRTKDHSMVGELVRNGDLSEEQARVSANTNIITRAIGANSFSEAEVDIVPYKKGDRFVLCTDGIWGAMPEPELVKMFCLDRPLSIVVEKISNKVDLYGIENSEGHHDNHTIALLQVKANSTQKESMSKKERFIIGICTIILLMLFFIVGYSLANNDSIQDFPAIEKHQSQPTEVLNDSTSSRNNELSSVEEVKNETKNKDWYIKFDKDKTPNQSNTETKQNINSTNSADKAESFKSFLKNLRNLLEDLQESKADGQTNLGKLVEKKYNKLKSTVIKYKEENSSLLSEEEINKLESLLGKINNFEYDKSFEIVNTGKNKKWGYNSTGKKLIQAIIKLTE